MFTSWLKRSSLKQKSGRRGLLLPTPVRNSPILLVAMMGIFLVLGLFVVSQSYAASVFAGH